MTDLVGSGLAFLGFMIVAIVACVLRGLCCSTRRVMDGRAPD
jgi:hypothetical protein